MPVTQRRCYVCTIVKPICEFYPSKRKNGGGYQYECKSCTRSYKTEFRRKHYQRLSEALKKYKRDNPEKIRAARNKSAKANPDTHYDYMLKKSYGLSKKDYEQMLADQDGKCAICGKTESTGRSGKLHVDHCHTTGMVRGLLCCNCNQGIGRFLDDPKLLISAAAYLRNRLSRLRSRVSESSATASAIAGQCLNATSQNLGQSISSGDDNNPAQHLSLSDLLPSLRQHNHRLSQALASSNDVRLSDKEHLVPASSRTDENA